MKLVHESLDDFTRGGDPYKKLGLGRYRIPSVEELIGHKKWANDNTMKEYERHRSNAMQPGKSDGYRKYIQHVIEEGHIISTASSIVMGWIINANGITVQDVVEAMGDLWGPADTDSIDILISYAKRNLDR